MPSGPISDQNGQKHPGAGGGGDTPLFGLYGDVPLDSVWFFWPRCPKQGIQFDLPLSQTRYGVTSLETLTQTDTEQSLSFLSLASSLFLFLACDPEPARS